MPDSEWERTETVSFWASPVGKSGPCLCRATYDVLRENGHWTYRLRPGSLGIYGNEEAAGNGEQKKQAVA